MSRTVFGCLLLVVLLAGGILASVFLPRQNEAVAAGLETAARQALAGDLPGAVAYGEEARRKWESSRHIQAVFTDHDPLDAVDEGFALLPLHEAAGDKTAYAAQCVSLARQVKALGDTNGLQWWNIF